MIVSSPIRTPGSDGGGQRLGRAILVFVAAIAGSFLLYGSVLGLSFLSDDLEIVWRAKLGEPAGPAGFFRPLSDGSIALCYRIFGDDPTGYRAFNVIVHGLTAAMLVFLVERFPGRRSGHAGILAGLLFLCYPYHNEAVIWIVGRGASMATLFTSVFLWALAARLPRSLEGAITTASLFLGLLAYESALLMPLLALPMLRAIGAPMHRWLPLLGAWAVAIVAYFNWRSASVTAIVNEYGSSILQHDALTYVSNVPKALGRLFLPPDPDPVTQTAMFLLLLAIMLYIVYQLRPILRLDTVLKTQVMALSTMLSTACLVGITTGVSTRTTESDRFLYMPSVFLCAIAALLIQRMPERRRLIFSLSLIGLSTFALHRSMGPWRMASTIIRTSIADLPPAPAGHRLFIIGVPGDTAGAFIFRHGFQEGLLMAGRDTSGMVPVGAMPMPRRGDSIVSLYGDTLTVNEGDRMVPFRRFARVK